MSRPRGPSTPYAVLTVAGLTAAVLLESLIVTLLVVLVTSVIALLMVSPWLTWSPRSATDDRNASQQDRVLIVSASVGAGHDGAAIELAREARAAGYAVDQVDFLDLLPLRLGPLMRSAYHWQIRVAPATWGWLLDRLQRQPEDGWACSLPGRLAHKRLLAACRPHTRVVVSTTRPPGPVGLRPPAVGSRRRARAAAETRPGRSRRRRPRRSRATRPG